MSIGSVQIHDKERDEIYEFDISVCPEVLIWALGKYPNMMLVEIEYYDPETMFKLELPDGSLISVFINQKEIKCSQRNQTT